MNLESSTTFPSGRALELSGDELVRMHELLSSQFVGVALEQFLADLAEKHWALVDRTFGKARGLLHHSGL